MSLPVIWVPSAKDDYAALLEYVEQHFGLDATYCPFVRSCN